MSVNVWTWPCVRYVYATNYSPWVSPWRWGAYPYWWKPWRPLGWSVWHPLRITHHRYGYRTVTTHRIVHARSIYKPIRVTSTRVNTRYAGARTAYRATRKPPKSPEQGQLSHQKNNDRKRK
ncbi:MAG: hypothetical protein IPJ13_01325 [Saprospiraceae bacterium]|nr:hypothetical protein [Saprospiraceae bacterium]